jgi:hypothetical protein
MPSPNATSRDTTAADGTIYRTCVASVTHAGPRVLPLTEDNFFHRRRANGALWIDARCQDCRREVDRRNRRARAAGSPVRPRRLRTATTRKFGVEIEMILSAGQRALVREMTARGLSCTYEGYTHTIRRGSWKVVTDASLPAGGLELVSPPLSGEEGFRQLQLASEALEAAGAVVRRSCGLHVHHDVSDLDAPAFGRLARGWSRNQGNTDYLVAASRRGSRWAAPLNEREVRHIEGIRSLDRETARSHFNSYRVDRYRSLNVACFPRYGTVEIRQHQGTLNGAKIAAWVRFGQAFITAASAGDVSAAESTSGMLEMLQRQGGLDADTATYLQSRADHFEGRQRVAA